MILRKISKIGAIGCQILRLKCTKLTSVGAPPQDLTVKAYSAPPDPLAVFKGPTSKGEEGKGGREVDRKRKGRGGREGEVGDGKGRKGKGGRRGGLEHAPTGIFESRRLCK